MASKRGSAILIEEAQAQVDTLLPRLCERLGMVPPIRPASHRDPLQREVQQIQWLADTLDAIDRAVEAMQAAPQEPSAEHPRVDPDALQGETAELETEQDDVVALDVAHDRDRYQDLKLDQLKAIAGLAGAADEDVAKLRAKAEVLKVIAARIASEEFQPVMFTVREDGEIARVDPPAEADEARPGPDITDQTGKDA